MAAANPADSALVTAASRRDGWICSCEAWMPYSVIPAAYPPGGTISASAAVLPTEHRGSGQARGRGGGQERLDGGRPEPHNHPGVRAGLVPLDLARLGSRGAGDRR